MTQSFNPLKVLRMLRDGGVEFVIIGGFAGTLYGSSLLTRDLDVCYARSRENIEKLVSVLESLNASLRGVDDKVPFQLDVESIENGDSFTFSTDAGPFDILGIPAGTEGFDQLRRNAVLMDIGDGIDVAVAAIDDLIVMKRSAGRPQDLAAIEILAALRRELERQP